MEQAGWQGNSHLCGAQRSGRTFVVQVRLAEQLILLAGRIRCSLLLLEVHAVLGCAGPQGPAGP